MNNYTKMNPKSFEEAVKAGEYDSLTGARRAIGRSQMSDADKKKCNKVADAYFDSATGIAKTRAGKHVAKPGSPVARARPAATQTPDPISSTSSTVAVTREAMEGLARAKAADPNVDVRGPVQTGVNILSNSLQKLHQAFQPTPLPAPHLNGASNGAAAKVTADLEEDGDSENQEGLGDR